MKHCCLVAPALLTIVLAAALLPASSIAQAPDYLTQWGTEGSGDGQFEHPTAVAVDGSGRVYVADNWNDRIQAFTSSGAYLTQWGTFGTGDGQFYGPNGVATCRDGSVYVVDPGNNRIQKFTSTGDVAPGS